jgi:antitoxin HigA-1
MPRGVRFRRKSRFPAYRRVHPGAILREELAARGLSGAAFADALRVSPSRIGAVLAGRARVSPDLAVRLSQFFGNDAEFWGRLQAGFDVAMIEASDGPRIRREVRRAA